ncbi:copper chaperone PCu(A)C [Sphingomonas sediminicola]|uniref:Copper chaperone PCu(A)C n=1 Tax=Sphingomonas sediminicola TaxID=386874 RepID=A0ABX6T520_9SPHN|nr:copper chaperone PCu(A)C [Sphingomonas sediminicola]
MKPILLAALLLASCSKGGPPDVRISDAWARETISGQTSTAAYMILKNEGAGDDRLVSVSAQPPLWQCSIRRKARTPLRECGRWIRGWPSRRGRDRAEARRNPCHGNRPSRAPERRGHAQADHAL